MFTFAMTIHPFTLIFCLIPIAVVAIAFSLFNIFDFLYQKAMKAKW